MTDITWYVGHGFKLDGSVDHYARKDGEFQKVATTPAPDPVKAATMRPGMYAGPQGDRTEAQWIEDAIEAVTNPTAPIIEMKP